MGSTGQETIITILLIDDSASVREVLRVALESNGYSVIEAADGREGVRLYREHRPVIVRALHLIAGLNRSMGAL